MGKRGPKPKPIETKVQEGNHHMTKNIQNRMAKSVGGEPLKPSNISPEASAIWDEVMPVLTEMRVVDKGNGLALALLCETQAIMDAYTIYFQRMRGHPYPDNLKGMFDRLDETPFRMVASSYNEAHANTRRCYASFGLTPSDRGTIEKTKEPGKGTGKLGEKRTG